MHTKTIATCGILCALAIVIMLVGSFIGVGTYAAPLLAILALLPIHEIYGNKIALTAFLGVAILGLLLLPDRELAVFYCGFGWWPVAKTYIDRIASKGARIAVKAFIYIAVILIMMFLVINILGIGRPEGDVLMHVFYIPGLPIPFTWIDVLVIIIGAIMFFFIDTRLEELSGGMTVKLKKMIHL